MIFLDIEYVNQLKRQNIFGKIKIKIAVIIKTGYKNKFEFMYP